MLMSKCKGDKQGPEACKRDIINSRSYRYSTYIKYAALHFDKFDIQTIASFEIFT